MKTLIILLLLCVNSSYAQEWRKYHRSDLGFTYGLVDYDYMVSGRHFRINPYDNSLWMATKYRIQTLGSDGSIKYFGAGHLSFQSPFQLATFEFLPGKVFILDVFQGVYLYENEEPSMMYAPSGLCNGIATDGDTLYILRENNPIVKWTNENLYYLFNAGYAKRILVKNNLFWLSDGFGPLTGITMYTEDGNYNWYNPNTTLLMDYDNFDYKFSPHHDTLYVAGNKGLSLLHNLTFFDSIAPDNTINMPAGVILDFEFDADDNIWALFGSDAQTPISIAHYNQVSKTWDAYYDAGNSDLNFDTYCSIELDTSGNLWMVNSNYIHVLELGTLPNWVSVKQPSFKPTVSVYPNPATESFFIETDERIEEIHLADQLGKRVKTFNPKEKEFPVAELPSGIYFVEIVNEGGEKRTVKLVKE